MPNKKKNNNKANKPEQTTLNIGYDMTQMFNNNTFQNMIGNNNEQSEPNLMQMMQMMNICKQY